MAPTGWPLDKSPPLGLIAISPSKFDLPSSINLAPSPFSANPNASATISSAIANAS